MGETRTAGQGTCLQLCVQLQKGSNATHSYLLFLMWQKKTHTKSIGKKLNFYRYHRKHTISSVKREMRELLKRIRKKKQRRTQQGKQKKENFPRSGSIKGKQVEKRNDFQPFKHTHTPHTSSGLKYVYIQN